MPNLNPRQFSGGVKFPSHQQLALPGLGGESEQMRLFDTQRAGPANIYTANPSRDAAEWRDQDRFVELSEDEQEIVDDEEYELSGEFFEFPIGSEGREYLANQDAYTRAGQEARRQGTFLGEDAYPSKVDPGLRFDDLQREGDDWYQEDWWSPEGTLVGRVEFHEDEWGPNVDHAEINPLYRGRGFSREAISDFAGGLESGQGIVHAGGFTDAGRGAFHAKGIPTERDIEESYSDWVEGLEPDEDEVREEAAGRYPEEDWSSPDAPQGFLDEIRIDLQEQRYTDPDSRAMFRENLESMQEQLLENLPGRRGAFKQGWKPQAKFGRQEELPDMPLKYTGGLA